MDPFAFGRKYGSQDFPFGNLNYDALKEFRKSTMADVHAGIDPAEPFAPVGYATIQPPAYGGETVTKLIKIGAK